MAETIEDLTLDAMIQITNEAILRLPPSLTSSEALEFREVVERQVREIVGRGRVPEVPFD